MAQNVIRVAVAAIILALIVFVVLEDIREPHRPDDTQPKLTGNHQSSEPGGAEENAKRFRTSSRQHRSKVETANREAMNQRVAARLSSLNEEIRKKSQEDRGHCGDRPSRTADDERITARPSARYAKVLACLYVPSSEDELVRRLSERTTKGSLDWYLPNAGSASRQWLREMTQYCNELSLERRLSAIQNYSRRQQEGGKGNLMIAEEEIRAALREPAYPVPMRTTLQTLQRLELDPMVVQEWPNLSPAIEMLKEELGRVASLASHPEEIEVGASTGRPLIDAVYYTQVDASPWLPDVQTHLALIAAGLPQLPWGGAVFLVNTRGEYAVWVVEDQPRVAQIGVLYRSSRPEFTKKSGNIDQEPCTKY